MSRRSQPQTRYCLDVVAAYNREGLPLPPSSGMMPRSIEEILAHPFHWAYLSERDAEEVLMEIYVARRTRMQ